MPIAARRFMLVRDWTEVGYAMVVWSRSPRATRGLALILAAGVGCMPVALPAQSVPTPPAAPAPASATDTVRLSDEERLAILDRSTPESVAAARGEMPVAERKTLGIHGEVGAMVGTNGARALYGVAQIPLGDSAAATVAFESSRYGYRR